MTSFERAQTHAAAGHWKEAIQSCKEALANDPKNLVLLNFLGVALVSSGRKEEGVVALNAAAKVNPLHPGVIANLAMALHAVGDLEGASLTLRQLCSIDPSNAFAFNRLGSICLEQGDLEVAAKVMRRAAILEVNDTSYWSEASITMLRLGRIADAKALITNALNISSDYAYANTIAASIDLCLGSLDSAAQHISKALKVEPRAEEANGIISRIQKYRAASTAAANLEEPSPGLVLRGPFNAISGYAGACCCFAQTLCKQRIPIHLIGLHGQEHWSNEDLHQPVPARAVVNIAIPPAVEPVPGLATVLYTMFEGTAIPPAWLNHSERCDLIIVPTNSSLHAWAACGFPKSRLRVCPLGVNPEPAPHKIAPLVLTLGNGRLISSYRHRFLNVSDLIPRKNLAGLFRVWLRATRRTDDAVLILKTGRGTDRDIASLRRLMIDSENAVGRRFADAARISFVNQMFDEAQMAGLFASANYYWSMSHGEGWDLPLSRAGAMGLGLIAPAHSSYLDYLNSTVARMIPSTVVAAQQPYSKTPYPPFFGLNWWQPDEEAAISIIEAIVNDRDVSLPDASRHLMANFTWDQAAYKLQQILLAEGMLG
jgi:Flp pilus assembly protein TadD